MKKQARPIRKRMRLSGWDYSRPGAYFVTLCTQNRVSLFYDVEIRALVEMWWHRLEEKFEQVGIDEFVIMPDHLHGIILIHEHGNTLPATSLGCVVQWFKTMTTNAYIRGVREEDWLPFSSRLWQRGYYDRVIRNEQDLDRIRRYINDNPDQLLGLE